MEIFILLLLLVYWMKGWFRPILHFQFLASEPYSGPFALLWCDTEFLIPCILTYISS